VAESRWLDPRLDPKSISEDTITTATPEYDVPIVGPPEPDGR
jgi:hypothetical protein